VWIVHILLVDLCLVQLSGLQLPNAENTVLASRRHKPAVASELDDPDSAVAVLKFDCLLQAQVVEIVVSFLVQSRFHSQF